MPTGGAVRPIRVAVVGASGPHARKTWAPILRQLQASGRVEVVLATELVGKGADLGLLYGNAVEILLTHPFHNHSMSEPFAESLRAAVRRLKVDAVIVATEPLSHLSYMEVLVPLNVHLLFALVGALASMVETHPLFGVSVVLTANIHVRVERLEMRRRFSPEEVGADDLAVVRSPHKFLAMEAALVEYATAWFDAHVIDTGDLRLAEVVDEITRYLPEPDLGHEHDGHSELMHHHEPTVRSAAPTQSLHTSDPTERRDASHD